MKTRLPYPYSRLGGLQASLSVVTPGPTPTSKPSTPAEFESETEKNEALLRKYMAAQDWHWLRYPFLHEGETIEKHREIPTWLRVFPLKGHIAFVDPQMNSQTGAIRIAAAFPNPGNVLRPGQFGRVKADTEVRHGALLIPQVAVQEFQGLHQVYVAGSDGKAHLATVQFGAQVGTNWLLESGVGPGALVVTDNLQKLVKAPL
jgi:hypothetical protein